MPKGVLAGQLTEVVKKWLREHPAEWHYTADSLVAKTFDEVFPCRWLNFPKHLHPNTAENCGLRQGRYTSGVSGC